MRRPVLVAAAWALLLTGAAVTAQSLYLPAKGWLAMQLIADAYARAPGSRPWPQADFRAVARLQVARLGVDQIVLDQASPRALAFGPGLLRRPHRSGPIISAHRDTHFNWVGALQRGDEVHWEQGGDHRRYRVASFAVVNSAEHALASVAEDILVLTTCWPLDARTAGGDLRYVITAVAMP
jgi:sortase A